MDMLAAIIIEDEKKSRENLHGMLEIYCPNVKVVGQADGVKAGIEVIEKNKPDIVFLDIQMPDGSGFKLLEQLNAINFEIIFTTAFDQYAIKAIKYSALDYLLKPIDPEDLVGSVKKVEQKVSQKKANESIQVLLENIKSRSEEPEKIILSTAKKIHVVKVDDIVRCESDNYYTTFFFTNGKTMLISKTLKENEDLLSSHNFIRPHKSHLVNVKYIKSFLKRDGGYIRMTDGSEVPVSRRKKEKIIEIINNL